MKVDLSQYQSNEEETPLEYDSTGIDQAVQLQTKEEELSPPTYWQQTKNSYNQSKLVDYSSSEQNQYMKEVDNQLKDTDMTDENKESVKFYKDRIMPYENDLIENLYNEGDWYHDADTNAIHFNNQNGLQLQQITDWDTKLKGYAWSKYHVNLSEENLRAKSQENTRKEWTNYQKDLDVDNYWDNFGSQVLGNVGAYLTDPIGAGTLAIELATLGAATPAIMGFNTVRGFKLYNTMRRNGMGFREATKAAKETEIMLDKSRSFVTMGTEGFEKGFMKYGASNRLKLAGTEMGIGGISETVQQELSFDFHHGVLPEFNVFQKNLQIGLVALSAGTMAYAGSTISNSIMTNNLKQTADEGARAQKEVDDMFKSEPNLDEAGQPKTKEAIDEEKKAKPTKEIDNEPDLQARQKEIDDAYNDLQDCIVGQKFATRKPRKGKK